MSRGVVKVIKKYRNKGDEISNLRPINLLNTVLNILSWCKCIFWHFCEITCQESADLRYLGQVHT